MDINKLVNEQIQQVRVRRMQNRHPKGYDIKVSTSMRCCLLPVKQS